MKTRLHFRVFISASSFPRGELDVDAPEAEAFADARLAPYYHACGNEDAGTRHAARGAPAHCFYKQDRAKRALGPRALSTDPPNDPIPPSPDTHIHVTTGNRRARPPRLRATCGG
jgi:hypothetical protein